MKSNIIYLDQLALAPAPCMATQPTFPLPVKHSFLENFIPFWLAAWTVFGLIESLRGPCGF